MSEAFLKFLDATDKFVMHEIFDPLLSRFTYDKANGTQKEIGADWHNSFGHFGDLLYGCSRMGWLNGIGVKVHPRTYHNDP